MENAAVYNICQDVWVEPSSEVFSKIIIPMGINNKISNPIGTYTGDSEYLVHRVRDQLMRAISNQINKGKP